LAHTPSHRKRKVKKGTKIKMKENEKKGSQGELRKIRPKNGP